MSILIRVMTYVALCATVLTGSAHASSLDEDISRLQEDWAVVNYQASGEAQLKEFEALAQRAAGLSARYPQRAEPLVWEGIVLSTYAGAKGGLGALSLAKKARARLEAALQIEPNALDGSIYTSLGTLYHKVPGFPLGFGDDRKARGYLLKALSLNPESIDPNYFYGAYLYDQGEYEQARDYLQRALSAPARDGRRVADAGRRQEAAQLLEKVKGKAG